MLFFLANVVCRDTVQNSYVCRNYDTVIIFTLNNNRHALAGTNRHRQAGRQTDRRTHIHIDIDTQIHSHTSTQTYRKTDITDRQTDRQTDRHARTHARTHTHTHTLKRHSVLLFWARRNQKGRVFKWTAARVSFERVNESQPSGLPAAHYVDS